MLTRQLPLGFNLRDDACFSNFIVADNVQLVKEIQATVSGTGEMFIYLWGNPGCGKSHLLQAAIRSAGASGNSVAYLPMGDTDALDPRILEGLESTSLVCIDDLERIGSVPGWEEALFHLFNRLRDQRVPLLVSAICSPSSLPLQLPDLKSRMSWGLSYQVAGLDEQHKRQLIMEDADRRGLSMSRETVDYILRHTQRDPGSLKGLLAALDHASLAAGRRVTIPFVKAYLATELS